MSDVAVTDAAVDALCGDLSSIRAPRGAALNARSWQTEAPLRMLLNNLDPEVAEHPEQLVVYGGSGKAARSHEALKAIVGTLLRLRDDETLLVQSGKPVGVFRTTEWAPRVLIANSLLVPRWASWERVPPPGGRGADDVRADDRGELDLHRHPGDPAGDVPDVRGRGRDALRDVRPDGADDPDGRPRGHGRRPAARCDDGRGRNALHRGRSEPHRASARDAVSRRGDLFARRRARARARSGRRRSRALGGASWQRGRRRSRASAARGALRSRHRPDRRARPADGVRPAGARRRRGLRAPAP